MVFPTLNMAGYDCVDLNSAHRSDVYNHSFYAFTAFCFASLLHPQTVFTISFMIESNKIISSYFS